MTRNPTPIAYFVARGECPVPTPVRLVMEERCFEETVFRVEQDATCLYLVDLLLLNGTPPPESDRPALLARLLDEAYMHVPVFETYKLLAARHDPEEACPDVVDVVATDIPDVYKIPAVGEYLRVRTLVLSRYLRTLGPTFQVPAARNSDGTWTPIVSSGPVTNEEP